MPRTEKQIVGRKGEDLAVRFLQGLGYSILETNYWKKWGEIDIVAKKGKVLHFVEVKTVSYETSGFAPEDRVGFDKRKRFARVIETYLLERDVTHETPFQVDVLSICLSHSGGGEKFDFLEDIIL